MRRTIATVLAAATIAGFAAPVAAQTKYYARQKVMKATTEQPATYVPTYSQTYSTCSGGTQSAPIASCAKSDGTAAALSSCSGSPQSVSRDCVPPKCPPLVQYQWFATNTGYVNIAKVSSLAAAQNACEAEAAKGTPGVCGWTGDTKYGDYMNVYYHKSLAMQTLGSSSGTIYAVACK